jgi:multiple sugar transport system permease protein
MTAAAAIAGAPPAARPHRQRLIEAFAGCGFAFPAFLLLLLTNLVPLVVLFYLSFTDYELGALDTHFLGLDNFR